MVKHKRRLRWCLFVLGALLWFVVPAKTFAQNVTEGFNSDATLQKGMIVRLKPSDGSKVEPLTDQDAKNMLGVIVASSDSPVSLSTPANSNQVFVATTGQYDVLVSSQAGQINVGDYITISSLNGVGMKADGGQQVVLGKALQSFDGKTNVDGTSTLTTSTGQQTVGFGRILVDIDVAHNPIYHQAEVSGVPSFLVRASQIVTDKPVGALRIYASLVIVVLSLIVATIIIFTGVRSGMIAIGRNPLAKRTILRSLFQVTIISLIIFIIGLIAVYLLLKL
jgi:hypothetical protein